MRLKIGGARRARCRPAVRAVPDFDRPTQEWLGRMRAEIYGVQERRTRAEDDYWAGRLSSKEYLTLCADLRERLGALGLEMDDIHIARASAQDPVTGTHPA